MLGANNVCIALERASPSKREKYQRKDAVNSGVGAGGNRRRAIFHKSERQKW